MVTRRKKNKELLSIIVPAYRQEQTIVKDLQRIQTVVKKLSYNYEIIVVVDGKVDKTYEKAKQMQSRNIHVVGYVKNYGKGFALRYGAKFVKGDKVAFLDAGMDLHPKGLVQLLRIMEEENADIVIGSKVHPSSKVTYPMQRIILSRGYRLLVKTLFGLSVQDTQVGMKLFKREVIDVVMPKLLVKQYAFDIELLAVAYREGYKKIYEGPIELHFKNWSSITSKTVLRTVFKMLWDTAAVFYRLRILRYYEKK